MPTEPNNTAALAAAPDAAPEAGASTPTPKGGQGDTTTEELLRTPTMGRAMRLEVQGDRAAGDGTEADSREVVLAVSSEFEVRRDWPFDGIEVLDHRREAVRLDHFRDGAAVVTEPPTGAGGNIHRAGILVASVRDAWVGDDRRVWTRIRFSTTPEAERELAMVRDGTRRNVSIRYRIHTLEHTIGEKGAPDRFRATDWEPIHLALVNDPEDPTVGFGREAAREVSTTVVTTTRSNHEPAAQAEPNPKEGSTMPPDETTTTTAPAPDQVRASAGPDRDAIAAEIRAKDGAVRKEILALGRQFGRQELALEHLERGSSVLEFKDALLDTVKPGEALESNQDPHNLGMGEREAKRYSFFRALRYLENRNDPRLQSEAGLELEASRAISDATGEEPRGIFVPTDALRTAMGDPLAMLERGMDGHMTNGDRFRAMTMGRAEMGATVSALGQLLVPTIHRGDAFIDILRNTSAVMPRATILAGLDGNVQIPKKTVATAGGWLTAEGNDTAEDDITIGQEVLTAKDVGAHVIVRRRLLLQSSPDVENMIRMDLAMAIALAIDAAAVNGSGTGVPTGFLNDAGIGDWALATDPPASHVADPQWTDVLALWKLVAQGNALFGDLGWLMGANHAAHFLGREKGGSGSGRFIMEDLTNLMGYPVVLSEQCPADTVAFLNFRQIVVGMWGGLDLLVDPYTKSKAASLVIRAIQTADTVVRQEAAIAAWQDSTVA